MFIPQEEKEAIKAYYADPALYVDSKDAHYFTKKNVFPWMKITRSRFESESDDFDNSYRYFIFPSSTEGEGDIEIRIIRIFANDPKAHSCHVIGDKFYFHQNKNDLINANTMQTNNDDDDEEEEERTYSSSEASYNPDKLNLAEVYHYYKYEIQQDSLRIVKHSVDEDNNQYILKMVSDPHISPTLFSPFGISIIRTKVNFFRLKSITEIKKITIMPDAGQTLEDYLWVDDTEKRKISIEMKDLIACNILVAYLEQIWDKGIIHRDINACNICSKNWENLEGSVTFIDFEEASLAVSKNNTLGRGKAGYLGPEFFKTKEGYFEQVNVRIENGEQAFVRLLKENYQVLFSSASDIFALGNVLYELGLKSNSTLYSLLRHMLTPEPEGRPNGREINDFLVNSGLPLPSSFCDKLISLSF